MTVYEYAIRYDDAPMVFDPSWRCEADVVASFHGSPYCNEHGQVTGTLVRAVLGTMAWEDVA